MLVTLMDCPELKDIVPTFTREVPLEQFIGKEPGKDAVVVELQDVTSGFGKDPCIMDVKLGTAPGGRSLAPPRPSRAKPTARYRMARWRAPAARKEQPCGAVGVGRSHLLCSLFTTQAHGRSSRTRSTIPRCTTTCSRPQPQPCPNPEPEPCPRPDPKPNTNSDPNPNPYPSPNPNVDPTLTTDSDPDPCAHPCAGARRPAQEDGRPRQCGGHPGGA